MPNKADLLIKNASELVTLAGSKAPRVKEQMKELGIIRDGCLAIEGNKIIAVGRTNEVEKRVEVDKKTRVIDASGKTVMPGFVDPHTHLIFAGSREDELALKIEGATYLEILERGGGIFSTVKKTRGKQSSKPLLWRPHSSILLFFPFFSYYHLNFYVMV